MENKDIYSQEELEEIREAYAVSLYVKEELGKLESKMTDARSRLDENGRAKEASRAWGLTLTNRYNGARQAFQDSYEKIVPENIRVLFEAEGLSPDFKKLKLEEAVA